MADTSKTQQERVAALPAQLRQPVAAIWKADNLCTAADIDTMASHVATSSGLEEFELLQKLIYRKKNQHRTTRSFKYLQEIQRYLGLHTKLKLEDLLLDFGSLFISSRGGKFCKVPKGEAGSYVLRRFLSACKLSESIMKAIFKAAGEIQVCIARYHFVPFYLSTFAILARLRLLVLHGWLTSTKIYNELIGLVKCLPFDDASSTDLNILRLPSSVEVVPDKACPALKQIAYSDGYNLYTSAQEKARSGSFAILSKSEAAALEEHALHEAAEEEAERAINVAEGLYLRADSSCNKTKPVALSSCHIPQLPPRLGDPQPEPSMPLPGAEALSKRPEDAESSIESLQQPELQETRELQNCETRPLAAENPVDELMTAKEIASPALMGTDQSLGSLMRSNFSTGAPISVAVGRRQLSKLRPLDKRPKRQKKEPEKEPESQAQSWNSLLQL